MSSWSWMMRFARSSSSGLMPAPCARRPSRQGMQTMAADGWNKVAQGLTTVEEVLRVTQE